MKVKNLAGRKMGPTIIALILLIAGGAMVFGDAFRSAFSTKQQKLSRAWRDDLLLLKKAGTWPKYSEQIVKIEVSSTTDFLRNFFEGDDSQHLKELGSIIRDSKISKVKPDPGEYTLQIFSDQCGGNCVIVQYDLVDHNSNTVWELSRTLSF